MRPGRALGDRERGRTVPGDGRSCERLEEFPRLADVATELVGALRSNPMRALVSGGFLVTSFAAVALLRWPLVWVILALGVVSCVYAWVRLQPGAAGPEQP